MFDDGAVGGGDFVIHLRAAFVDGAGGGDAC